MVNIHELEDGGAVVGDGDIVVGRDHHLVKALRTEGSPQGVGNSPCRHNVALKLQRMQLYNQALVSSRSSYQTINQVQFFNHFIQWIDRY